MNRLGGTRTLQEETDIGRLLERGYVCEGGISKVHNTERQTDAVNPDLVIAAAEVTKTIKPIRIAYLEHHYYTGPNAYTEGDLRRAAEAFANRMRILKALYRTHADIQCVFSYWPHVAERVNAKKRLRAMKASKPDDSDDDEDVADPGQSKRAKTGHPDTSTGSPKPAPAQPSKT